MTRAQKALQWLPTLAPAVIAAFYATGVAAGPHLFDAGELAAAAWQLSGSHPPGQTVHALVAHVACLLPVGPIPARIALVSVICLWTAAVLAARAARMLCRRLSLDGVADWAATATAVSVMLAPPLVRQATRVEVYTLALALFAWSALELLRWAFDGERAPLLRAALIAGLCASVHPPHALAAVLLGAVIAVGMRREVLRQPGTLAAAAAFTLLSLAATTAYLPVRAAVGAAMWGDPTTASGLLAYVSGATFQHNTFVQQDSGYGTALLAYARHATVSLGVLPLLSALWLLSRPSPAPTLARVLLAAAALGVAAAAIQPLLTNIPDVVAYLGPTLLLIAIGGSVGFAHLVSHAAGGARVLAIVAMALSALNPAAWPRVLSVANADLPALETLGGSLTETPPPRALTITTTDFAGASWMMAQAIDGARPDVALFLSGFVTSSWQWRQLARHPALDGKPQRGQGRGAREAYMDGLLRTAIGAIPVALETDTPGVQAASVAGPYVVLRAVLPSADTPGERLVGTIATDRQRGPPGDHGSGDAIVRQYELGRARRLMVRGQTPQALTGFVRASAPLPDELRALAVSATGTDARAARPPIPVITEPRRFTASAGDAQRELSVSLWRVGETEGAQRLLRWQLGKGDPRALLQLAWLSAAAGERAAATKALNGFIEAAPSLAHEAAELRAQLGKN